MVGGLEKRRPISPQCRCKIGLCWNVQKCYPVLVISHYTKSLSWLSLHWWNISQDEALKSLPCTAPLAHQANLTLILFHTDDKACRRNLRCLAQRHINMDLRSRTLRSSDSKTAHSTVLHGPYRSPVGPFHYR